MTPIGTAVREYMSSPVHTVRVDERLVNAEVRMRQLGISALLAVTPEASAIGLVSQTDVLAAGRLRPVGWGGGAVLELSPTTRVADAMSTDLVYALPEDTIATAASMMSVHHVHRVVVMTNADYVGILSTTDVMRAVAASKSSTPVSTYMHAPVVSIDAHEHLLVALDRIERAHVSGLVVLEDDKPVGIFTRTEALAARSLPVDTPVEDVMSASTYCVNVTTPIGRAAAQCVTLAARRLMIVDHRQLVGVMTGIDFARAASGR